MSSHSPGTHTWIIPDSMFQCRKSLIVYKAKKVINQGLFKICWWVHQRGRSGEVEETLCRPPMLSDAILSFRVVGSWRSVKLIYFKGFYLLVTVCLDRGGQGMDFPGANASQDQVIGLCTCNIPSHVVVFLINQSVQTWLLPRYFHPHDYPHIYAHMSLCSSCINIFYWLVLALLIVFKWHVYHVLNSYSF